jgi:hypothetical protein
VTAQLFDQQGKFGAPNWTFVAPVCSASKCVAISPPPARCYPVAFGRLPVADKLDASEAGASRQTIPTE